jgi:5-methylcytosine-specific restriction endonuclease McrA
MIEKDKRWVNKKYTNWVATLPCTNCGIDDGTVVAHHLKGRFFPWGGGGTGMKANDWLVMALCYKCHDAVHNGDANILDYQAELIWKTQREAFKQGVLDYVNSK